MSLSCPDHCEAGEYLYVETNIPYCKQCPVNTFNAGKDTILIDGRMGDFRRWGEKSSSMPREMQLSCTVHTNSKNDTQFVRVNHDQDEDENAPQTRVCKPWTRTRRGIKAMESQMTDVYTDFTMTYPAYFMKEGNIEVKFRVDATELNAFKFIVDGEIVHLISNQPNDDWQVYSYDVTKGAHVL